MARKRSFLGKNPGGKFRGIPGNPSNGMGWGGVFKKKGDWGILNPMEWSGFSSRIGFGKMGPRPQGQLQQVIEFNLGLEKQMQDAARQRRKQRAADQAAAMPPVVTPPGDVPRRVPTGKVTPMPTTGGSTAPAGGKSAPAAKPKPISAAVKAMKNPVKRGR